MVICTIEGLAEHVGVELKELERSVYDAYDCGPYIKWDDKGVTIGSIVEGSDAEFEKTLKFPFQSEDYEDWLNELEDLCEKAWNEANTED